MSAIPKVPQHQFFVPGGKLGCRISLYNSLKTALLNLNTHLAEMLLVPLILIGISGVLQVEDLFVDHRMDVIGLNGAVHLFKLQPRSYQETSDRANAVEAIEEARLIALCAA